jgi:hypothetical protein
MGQNTTQLFTNILAVFQTANGSEGPPLHVRDGSISVFCLWVQIIFECTPYSSIHAYLLHGDIFLINNYRSIPRLTQLLCVR